MLTGPRRGRGLFGWRGGVFDGGVVMRVWWLVRRGVLIGEHGGSGSGGSSNPADYSGGGRGPFERHSIVGSGLVRMYRGSRRRSVDVNGCSARRRPSQVIQAAFRCLDRNGMTVPGRTHGQADRNRQREPPRYPTTRYRGQPYKDSNPRHIRTRSEPCSERSGLRSAHSTPSSPASPMRQTTAPSPDAQ